MSNSNVTPAITGIGLVTPLGNGVGPTWESLLGGRCIDSHAKAHATSRADVPKVSRLAIDAAMQAVGDVASFHEGPETALVVGTSKGPVEEWLKAPSTLSDPGQPVTFGLARVATDVAEALRLGGPRITCSSACVSGLHALIRAVMLIRSGEAARVLVVAAEASLHPLFVANFNRLGVLPAAGVGCRPFDHSREGFLISECAAAVVIEARSTLPKHVRIEGFAFGSDAMHLTGVDPKGRVLRRILSGVCGGSRRYDFLHGHGTATVANDAVELLALADCFGDPVNRPTVYSHKAGLGHSLGAAGLVSVVLNVMAHDTGLIPPNVRTRDPLPAPGLEISGSVVRRPIARSLAVAAGFGGGIAAVSLRS